MAIPLSIYFGWSSDIFAAVDLDQSIQECRSATNSKVEPIAMSDSDGESCGPEEQLLKRHRKEKKVLQVKPVS